MAKTKRDTKVLATYNIKGGVGKTSAAVNLAYLAARDGHSTLLWDLDPQAASTYLFRVRPKVKGGGHGLLRKRSRTADHIKATDHELLDLLPADFSYRHLDLALDQFKKPAARLRKVLEPLLKDYDYIFLDCPPSISLVSESIFEAADALLVPVIPATLSSRAYEQLDELSRRGRVGKIGGTQIFSFFSMAEVLRPLHLQVMERLRGIEHLKVLGAAIPVADEVEMMGEERNPVGVFAPTSAAAVSYEALWAEIEGRLRPDSLPKPAASPVVEPPVVETPVVETPMVETPVVETPMVETPVVETPVAETPPVETPQAQTPTG
jgi:chromosome partitioning protein